MTEGAGSDRPEEETTAATARRLGRILREAEGLLREQGKGLGPVKGASPQRGVSESARHARRTRRLAKQTAKLLKHQDAAAEHAKPHASRAMIAAQLAEAPPGSRTDLVPVAKRPLTAAEAGALLKVSVMSVRDAKLVQRRATPEQLAAVERGELAVSTLAKELRRRATPKPKKRPRRKRALKRPQSFPKPSPARGRKLAAEWKAYQATWQAPIYELQTSPEKFYDLRRNILNLSRARTARLLRVGAQAVDNWERGKRRVPFYAYLSLLLISESLHYKFANEAWAGWQLHGYYDVAREKHVAELVNPALGAYFTPEDLEYFHWTMQEAQSLRDQSRELRDQVNSLTQENTEIRELFRVNGLTAELQDMRSRVEELFARINTAAILKMPSAKAAAA